MNYLTALLAMTVTLFTGGPISTEQPFHLPIQPVASTPAEQHSSYESVSSPFPTEVESALAKVSRTGGYQVVQGNKTYVVIGLGQRSTGGYKVEIDGIETTSDQVIVKAHEVKPSQGSMSIQVISYPTKVIALPKTTLPVTVELK
ncbi:protease complex subunit PrcB family protein [Brevibacillus ginsengisoli]|uniref:protease complex subunit PrcB family protein n=1 Tax=Brevibacillus ginsengisoli TaxID=363854 RepID=UPI003CEC222C